VETLAVWALYATALLAFWVATAAAHRVQVVAAFLAMQALLAHMRHNPSLQRYYSGGAGGR
jgi:hypothetical protein